MLRREFVKLLSLSAVCPSLLKGCEKKEDEDNFDKYVNNKTKINHETKDWMFTGYCWTSEFDFPISCKQNTLIKYPESPKGTASLYFENTLCKLVYISSMSFDEINKFIKINNLSQQIYVPQYKEFAKECRIISNYIPYNIPYDINYTLGYFRLDTILKMNDHKNSYDNIKWKTIYMGKGSKFVSHVEILT